jgi:hypothetical protein
MHKYTPFILVLIAFLFLSCPADSTDSAYAPDLGIIMDLSSVVTQGSAVIIPKDFAGLCHTGYSADLEREYGMLDELGVVWLHRDFTWNSIQSSTVKDLSPDQWNWTSWDSYVARGNTEDKKIMGMLLYQADWIHTDNDHSNERKVCDEEIPLFTRYAVETVKRYNGNNGHGYVDAWLIWNEPDLYPRFWTGTQEEFFALTKATAEAIRELDEEEDTQTILLGGVFTSTVSDDWITGFFEYENGAIKDLIDGVAFHPYGPGSGSSASVFNGFKEKVAPYGFADKIWLNEMGYPTYLEKGKMPPGRYMTDQWEGDMPRVVTQTFTLLAAAGARNLTWYHFSDGADRSNSNSENWFGLVWRKSDEEWVKKGGYHGYALCANNLPGKTYKALNLSGVSNDIQTYYFEGDDGSRTLIIWNAAPLEASKITLTLGGANHKLWNVETGAPTNVEKTSTHTLYPMNPSLFYGDQDQNILFFTWDE